VVFEAKRLADELKRFVIQPKRVVFQYKRLADEPKRLFVEYKRLVFFMNRPVSAIRMLKK